MTLNRYPRIERGTRWEQTSAKQWNNALGDIASTSDRAVQASRPVSRGRSEFADTDRVPVVVHEADEAGGFLRISRIKYKNTPPRPGEASYDGSVFVAWPVPPVPASEFATLVASRDDPIASDTPVVMAYHRGPVWFVEKPATGGGVAVSRFEVVPHLPSQGISNGANHFDYVVCWRFVEVDGEVTFELADPDVGFAVENFRRYIVAKPEWLRRSYYDGRVFSHPDVNGIGRWRWEAFGDSDTLRWHKRNAVNMLDATGQDVEEQWITPAYFGGARIMAQRFPRAALGTARQDAWFTDNQTPDFDPPVVWMDINANAVRDWAARTD